MINYTSINIRLVITSSKNVSIDNTSNYRYFLIPTLVTLRIATCRQEHKPVQISLDTTYQLSSCLIISMEAPKYNVGFKYQAGL